jgi:molecular chaperone HscA
LNLEERKEIEEKIAGLEKTLAIPDPRAIKAASDALNRATEEFAARRMNASVRRALAGKSVASLDA